MANRRGKYLLTQRRRAALKKAQEASARKRRGRRRVAARVAGGAGILAVVGGGAFVARRYVKKVGEGGPTALPAISSPSQEVIPYRPPRAKPKLKISSRYRDSVSGKYMMAHKLKKLRAKRERARIRKNDKRRMAYWSGRRAKAEKVYRYDKHGNRIPHNPKKVGGSPRKNARKTPQERMKEKEARRVDNAIKQGKIKNVRSLDDKRRKKK